MTLTARDIEDRFEEAAYTLRRLPEKDRPRGYGTSWPPVVQEAKHAYGYTPEAPMRVIPSAAAITRMEGMLRLADVDRSRGCPHRLAPCRRHALASGLLSRRCCAIKRLAALGGGAFDDCKEAEFGIENKA